MYVQSFVNSGTCKKRLILKTYHQEPSKIQGVIFYHRTEQQQAGSLVMKSTLCITKVYMAVSV